MLNDNIVFTDSNKLHQYNEKLLKEFIHYLNLKAQKRHNIFHCGASVSIIENDEIIDDFLQSIILKNGE